MEDSAGKKLGTNLGKGLYFLADMAESGVKGAIKWVGDIVDMAWDVGSFVVDTGTNLASGWNGTNLWSEEWFLDKANKGLHKSLDETNIIDSSFGQTKSWKWLLKATEVIGEVLDSLLPAMSGIKIAKNMWNVFRQSPKAIKELKELRAAGNVTQEAVNAIAKKYTADGVIEWAAKWLKEWVGNFSKEYKSTKEILEMLQNKTPDELGLLAKSFPKLSKYISKGKDWTYTLWGAAIIGSSMKEDDISLPPQDWEEATPEEMEFISSHKIEKHGENKVVIDGEIFDSVEAAMKALK